MCEKATDPNRQEVNQVAMPRENHMIYELKQRREYHLRELMNIQKAIEAIQQVGGLY